MNITEILEALVYVFVVILSMIVIPFVKTKVGAQNMDDFLKWVDIAVAAAEQLYDTMEGPKKKLYVMDYLTSKGFTVDVQDLDLAIEASVNRLHHELYGTVTVE